MMPYMIDWSSSPLVKGELEGVSAKLDSNNIPPVKEGGTSEASDGRFSKHPLRKALTDSSNKYEQASGRLNLTLEYYTQTQQIDTIIHHYYTADTQFPGLRTQFSYRDVALDPYWCNQ